MVRQCWSYVGVVERLKVNDIILGLGLFEMGWHKELWACVNMGVEVQGVKRVNGNVKSFFFFFFLIGNTFIDIKKGEHPSTQGVYKG